MPDACRAFLDADPQVVGRLAFASQQDADALLGNQTEETRTLASLAIQAGAFAATSFGAGFGGSVWALAHRDDAHEVGDRWLRLYRGACPERAAAACSFVATPAPGRMEVTDPAT